MGKGKFKYNSIFIHGTLVNPLPPYGALTFEGETDLLTFEGETEILTFETI